MRLAQLVTSAREDKKMTVPAAAKAADLTEKHWYRIEDGESANLTMKTATRIANTLDITVQQMADCEDFKIEEEQSVAA